MFEIPTLFATASAGEFASAGVQLLASTGVVDTLLFGAECDDVSLFKDAAQKLVKLENSGQLDSIINAEVNAGSSYASARAKALENYVPSEILSSPNNILGLEYCRYIYENNINMDIAIIKRAANDYNSSKLTGEISSASAIRNNMHTFGEIPSVPAAANDVYCLYPAVKADDISQLLHYKLLLDKEYEKYLDCNKDLADRIRNNLDKFVSFSQFCDLLKTKNIAYSRISRVLCHILLGITESDFIKAKENGYISYLRMLGFSEKGSTLLARIKGCSELPLLTAPNELISKYDIISSDIYRLILTEKNDVALPTEYTRRFELGNINNKPD